jgi:hypothetical protein
MGVALELGKLSAVACLGRRGAISVPTATVIGTRRDGSYRAGTLW